jgi:uncharacterized membrane protein YeaQ/YmgE (transglycosylase-associated protein family)
MIKRRLTRALRSIGLAGGLLVGTAGAARADALFPQLGGINETNRTEIVTALLTGL